MIQQLISTRSFSHLFNFMILGLLFPSNYIGALCLGVVWELFEECISKKKISGDLVIQHFKDYKNIWISDQSDQSDKKIKLMDVGLNMIGYYLGNKVRGFSPL
jgi:hypothetical protein